MLYIAKQNIAKYKLNNKIKQLKRPRIAVGELELDTIGDRSPRNPKFTLK